MADYRQIPWTTRASAITANRILFCEHLLAASRFQPLDLVLQSGFLVERATPDQNSKWRSNSFATATLSITKLDRFARSVLNLWELIQQVEKKSAGLIILDFGGNTIDTRTAAGRAMLNMFATMAQFEREVMLERQRVGIARAKAEGKYKGRKPTACNQAAEVRKLAAAGVAKVEIARRLGMHRASVYRILRD